ncbi:MAG: hypothetical protein LBV64_04130 [Mediterranea sp.]|jgi:MFS family permease|nr:hypothetical protein [Mediterranea sp.]
MKLQGPKIVFYVKRPLAEKISATFDFIKENWKVLLKYNTYLILPICLVQAIIANTMMSAIYSSQVLQHLRSDDWLSYGLVFWVSYGLMILCSLAGSVLFISIVYALMKQYSEREERLAGITFADLKPGLLRGLKRSLLMILFIGVIILLAVAIIILLGIVSRYTVFLAVPLLLASMIPLLLFAPVYLFENTHIIRAFIKAFRLGFATWSGVLVIAIVMGVISAILSCIASIPWTVASVVKYIFFLSDTQNEVTISSGYNFMQYVFAVIMSFGSYLAGIFVIVGNAYQYAHAHAKTANSSMV